VMVRSRCAQGQLVRRLPPRTGLQAHSTQPRLVNKTFARELQLGQRMHMRSRFPFLVQRDDVTCQSNFSNKYSDYVLLPSSQCNILDELYLFLAFGIYMQVILPARNERIQQIQSGN